MHTAIFITASSKKEARRIAEGLIKKKLAACVNIIDRVESLFWWKGKVDKAGELLLVVKTRKEKVPALIKAVKSLHSYELPEIIALPISTGYKPYLRWIDASVR